MRRSDNQIADKAVIEAILKKATVCHLGMCAGGRPYVVPLCFGYEDNTLYFHCASEGKKLDILRSNNNICFEVSVDCEVSKADRPCDWGMKYKSVIGFGKATFVEDVEAKAKALNVIMKQFAGRAFEFPEQALRKTTVVRIEVESVTGKESG